MATLRRLVWKRARGRCEYCGLAQTQSSLPLEIDHIRARKHRGPSTAENTCLACAYCNSAKASNAAGYDPLTDKLVPLFDPRRDYWKDHFEWIGPVLKGRTEIGRATIEVLGINRPERVEHRRLLQKLRKRRRR